MTNKPLIKCLELYIDHRGVTPHKLNVDWSESGYPVLSANNVKDEGITKTEEIRFIDEITYKKWMDVEIQRNDILMTSEAPAGQTYLWNSDEKIVVGQRLYALRTKKDVDPKYLTYYLKSTTGQREIERYCSGSTVFGISAKTFDFITVKLPETLQEQQRIGNILFIIDSKIENNNRINAELESLTKLIYDYWFVQFNFPDKNGKPYKSNGGKMVWNERLSREIPDGWKVDSLEDKIDFQRGISYSSDDIKDNNGTPMINLASIGRRKNYIPEGIKHCKGLFKENDIVKFGDMLLACTDLTRLAEIIGCPIWVPISNKGFIYSMDLAKIIILDTALIPSYLYMTLRTDHYHKYIKGFASGTNVLHLNLNGVKWYTISFPLKELQIKFHKLVSPMFQAIQENTLESKELKSIRDFLLPMLMNGQVKIKS